MAHRFDSKIAEVDWLSHRWAFEIRRFQLTGVTRHDVRVGPLVVSSHGSKARAERWIDGVRLESLATIVARYTDLHPAKVLIEGMPGRLARIPPELWATYDGIDLTRGNPSQSATVLSAKARALYPEIDAVFVRVYRVPRPQGNRR